MTRNTVPHTAATQVATRLKTPLRLTAAGLWGERLWRAFWPFVTVMMTGLALLMAGVAAVLAPYWAQALAGLVLVAGVWTLWRGLRGFTRPSHAETLARLDATLPGQPIAALLDDQAIGADDPASAAIWQAHQSRMADRLSTARAVAPDLRVAARDPYALRLIALIGLIMAAGFGSLSRVAQVGDLITGPTAQAAIPASWEGWIEPPAYTGRPSLYLNDQPPGPLAVPVGSRLTLRLYGAQGALQVSEDVSGATTSDPARRSVEIMRNGTLTITGRGGAEWRITAIGDVPPTIRPEGDLSRTLAGDLRQGFIATDDYGVAAGQAQFVLDLVAVTRAHGLVADPEPRAPVVIDLPMPYRGDRDEVAETLHDNLSDHPWAGLPVAMSLMAQDATGQTGLSQAHQIILPGRRFLNPLAAALIEQRRDLLWTRENGPRVAMILRAVSYQPDGLFPRETQSLRLRVLIRRLEMGNQYRLSNALRDELAQALWDMAVEIEDGALANAADRLHRAQERLEEALRQGATPEELAELMDELREAMRNMMDQMAQSQPEGQPRAPDPNATQVTPEDLQELMDQIQDLMEQGRAEEAMAMLEALREMMENMEVTQGQGGEGQQSPGEQAMEGLQDTLRQQQGLSDEAFRDLQEQSNPNARAGESDENVGRDGGQGRGQAHSGEGGEGEGAESQGDGQGGESGDAQSLADRQNRLREMLRNQQQGLPGAGTPDGQSARDQLGRAGDAMEGAEQALRDGDVAEALDQQAEAMEAMREGMRNLDDAMQQEQARQQGQQGTTQPSQNPTPGDPLGRDNPSGDGMQDPNGPLANGEDAYRRAEDLLDDIQRRSVEQDRSAQERDYLNRLLDRF